MNSSAADRLLSQALAPSHASTEQRLMAGVTLSRSPDWVTLAFDQPRLALSSAVVNGGLRHCSRWLNLRVDGTAVHIAESPATTVARLCQQQGWADDTQAMMTAASMNSLRIRRARVCGEDLAVLVTTGLANARRAGDQAEYLALGDAPSPAGTINLAIVTSARLEPAVMVDITITATEAKAAALQDMGIRSPVSGAIATGTGTDAIAVFSGPGPAQVLYGGKHTLFGQQLAGLVMAAIVDSVLQQGSVDQCPPHRSAPLEDDSVRHVL